MPDGELVMVPLPDPAASTVRVKLEGAPTAKPAVTTVSATRFREQGPVPLHPPPLQPVNVEPGAAAAVRVTATPLTKLVAHEPPQSMPGGPLVTVPLPVP